MAAAAGISEPLEQRTIGCRLVRTEELAGMQTAWNALVFRMEMPCPFLSWEWATSWLEQNPHLHANLQILGAWRGAELIGLLPLYRNRGVLKVISAQEVCADYVDVIASPEHLPEVIRIFADLLNRDSGWSAVSLEGIRRPSAIERLVLSLEGRTLFREAGPCPAATIGGGWEAYLQRRFAKKRRYNITRELRLGVERHGFSVRPLNNAEDIRHAIATLFALHRDRKSAQGIKSTFTSESIEAFHRRVAPALQAAGMLVLDIVEKDGVPMSALYGFRTPRKVWLYQTGASAAGIELGAGAFALANCLARYSNEGVERFDFLRGDEPYKQLWADVSETMWSATQFRSAWKGIVAGILLDARKWFRASAGRLLAS